jgi:hypothetical protein
MQPGRWPVRITPGSNWSTVLTNDGRKHERLIIALTCALFAIPAAAQSVPDVLPGDEEVVEDVRYYSVEVIVFEYASSVSAGNEVFDPVGPEHPEVSENPEIPGLDSDLDLAARIPVYGDTSASSAIASDQEDIIEFGEIDVVEEIFELTPIPSLFDIDFRLLTEEELTLSEVHKKLLTLDAYLPVLWGGWVQSTHEKDLTPPIQLRMLGVPPLHIDGSLTLYLKNYLHLVVDLTREQRVAVFQPVYSMEKPAQSAERSMFEDDSPYNVSESQTFVYQIQEDRLFNSGQLRYYDHPKFGVLARVSRVEIEDPDEEEVDDEPLDGRSMLSSTR